MVDWERGRKHAQAALSFNVLGTRLNHRLKEPAR